MQTFSIISDIALFSLIWSTVQLQLFSILNLVQWNIPNISDDDYAIL